MKPNLKIKAISINLSMFVVMLHACTQNVSSTPTITEMPGPAFPEAERGHLVMRGYSELNDYLLDPQVGLEKTVTIDADEYAFSPDHKWLAIAEYHYGDDSKSKSQLIEYATGKIAAEFPEAACFSWASDSKRFTYYAEGVFNLFSIDKNESWEILRSPTGVYGSSPLAEDGRRRYADLDCGAWVSDSALIFHYRKERLPAVIDGIEDTATDSTMLLYLPDVPFDSFDVFDGKQLNVSQRWEPIAVSDDYEWIVVKKYEDVYLPASYDKTCPCFLIRNFAQGKRSGVMPLVAKEAEEPGELRFRVVDFIGGTHDLLLETRNSLYRYSPESSGTEQIITGLTRISSYSFYGTIPLWNNENDAVLRVEWDYGGGFDVVHIDIDTQVVKVFIENAPFEEFDLQSVGIWIPEQGR